MKIIGEGSATALEKKPKGKCRKWRLRVQTSSGERTRRYRGTYSQAEEALRRFIGELRTPVTEIIFSEYSEKWISRRKRGGEIAPSTLVKNEQQIRILDSHFGGTRLHEITKSVAEDTLLNIKQGGTRSGKVLSGTYMNQLYATMKAIMESAVDDDLIAKNPLTKVKPPKNDTKKREALSLDTLVRFLAALDTLPIDSHTMGVRIAVLAGLRRGEIIGLQWGDVEPSRIKVRRSMGESDRMLKEPKTSSGIRDVPIPTQLSESLAQWKEVQADQLAGIGANQKKDTPVVTAAHGGYMHPQNFDRWWRKTRSSFNLDGVVLHELRHTYLTLLASSGASFQTIKDLAGWANISMADTYIHSDKNANNEAAKRLSKMIDSGTALGSDVPEYVPLDVPGREL